MGLSLSAMSTGFTAPDTVAKLSYDNIVYMGSDGHNAIINAPIARVFDSSDDAR